MSALFSSFGLIEVVDSKFPISAPMPATCCNAFSPKWILIPMELEDKKRSLLFTLLWLLVTVFYQAAVEKLLIQLVHFTGMPSSPFASTTPFT